MDKETAVQDPKGYLSNIAFKVGTNDKKRVQIMCTELGWTQQTLMAGLVRMITDEYERDRNVVKDFMAEYMP